MRLIRAATGTRLIDVEIPDEDALAAYVMGTASEEQAKVVRTALARSPVLRSAMLAVMADALGSYPKHEQGAFSQAAPPGPGAQQVMSPQQGQPGAPARRWIEWALGGWAVAATAALFFVLVLDGERPKPVGNTAVPSPEEGRPPAPRDGVRQPPTVSMEAIPTVRLLPPSRGPGDPQAAMVVVGPSTFILRVIADPPDVSEGSSIRARLTGPNGSLLLDETRPAGDYFPTQLLVLQAPGGFPPGKYTLRLEGQREGVFEEVQYAFIVESR